MKKLCSVLAAIAVVLGLSLVLPASASAAPSTFPYTSTIYWFASGYVDGYGPGESAPTNANHVTWPQQLGSEANCGGVYQIDTYVIENQDEEDYYNALLQHNTLNKPGSGEWTDSRLIDHGGSWSFQVLPRCLIEQVPPVVTEPTCENPQSYSYDQVEGITITEETTDFGVRLTATHQPGYSLAGPANGWWYNNPDQPEVEASFSYDVYFLTDEDCGVETTTEETTPVTTTEETTPSTTTEETTPETTTEQTTPETTTEQTTPVTTTEETTPVTTTEETTPVTTTEETTPVTTTEETTPSTETETSTVVTTTTERSTETSTETQTSTQSVPTTVSVPTTETQTSTESSTVTATEKPSTVTSTSKATETRKVTETVSPSNSAPSTTGSVDVDAPESTTQSIVIPNNVAPSSTNPALAAGLAYTGTNRGTLVVSLIAGLVLLTAGGVLLIAARRRGKSFH